MSEDEKPKLGMRAPLKVRAGEFMARNLDQDAYGMKQ